MTPCEELGYKVGDRFVALGGDGETFKDGEKVTLDHDDRSSAPRFVNESGIWQHVDLRDVKPITKSPFHKLTKADNSAKKLDKELARLNKMLPEGFEIVRTPEDPPEDMSDWRNWREGDLVTRNDPNPYSNWGANNPRPIRKGARHDGSEYLFVYDDDEDTEFTVTNDNFLKFHSRPAKVQS